MEQMSTAGLEELLRKDFNDPGGGAADMSALYHAAQVLANRGPDRSAAADRAWEVFWEKYRPFAENGSCYEGGVPPPSDAADGRRHPSSRRRWLCLGLAAAVLAALLLSGPVAAAACGRGLLAWWTDESMEIAPGRIARIDRDNIRIPGEKGDYAGLREALKAYGLTRQIAPQWLPEGFELADLIVDDSSSPSMILFHAAYSRGDDVLVMGASVYLNRADGEGAYSRFQKDAGEPVPYLAGGVTHMLATNAGRPIAVWASGPAECYLSGDISIEELKQMIDSIYW